MGIGVGGGIPCSSSFAGLLDTIEAESGIIDRQLSHLVSLCVASQGSE